MMMMTNKVAPEDTKDCPSQEGLSLRPPFEEEYNDCHQRKWRAPFLSTSPIGRPDGAKKADPPLGAFILPF